jgi:GT2 family glycosyltransferase
VRIRLQMTSAVPGRVEILVDTGRGWDDAECVERTAIARTLDLDFFVRLPRPASAIRLDPLDCEGEFRVQRLEIIPVPAPVALGHAVWTKLNLLLRHHRTGRALWNGLGLLLRGRLGRIGQKIHEALKGPSVLAPPPEDPQSAYEQWRRNHVPGRRERARLRAQAATIVPAPLISVLLPVMQGADRYLQQAVDSVRGQVYPNWELCVAASDTLAPDRRAFLVECTAREPRIRCRFLGKHSRPGDLWNLALTLAHGDYVALLGPSDRLPEHALAGIAQGVAIGQPDMLYADEDQIDDDGRHHSPFFKPDWSPEYMLSFVYTGRPAVYRTALVRELGGFRPQAENAVEDDLALRFTAQTQRIGHIADILYHRRTDSGDQGHPGREADAARSAVANYLETTGRSGTVSQGPDPRLHRVRLIIKGRPKVSILIPTAYRQSRSGSENIPYLTRCLASIRERTSYTDFEILILDNDASPPSLRDALNHWGIARASYALPFNWARAMKQGAAHATGEHLVFLDDDTEVITRDWLECLLEYSQQPGVGAVGARLEFPDGRLQHAGVTILDGVPRHPFYGAHANHPGHFFSNLVPRNYSAVTSACLMTRADVFRAVGGFREEFACNFNDIDYCLTVRSRGLRVVCNPYCRLYHHESATKSAFLPAELTAFRARWASRWTRDPYHNPNLSIRYTDFRVEPEANPASRHGELFEAMDIANCADS